jgi:short-subunit dehydrogenase
VELARAICLVTGASSGIGRATALELAHRGARLIISSNEQEVLEELAGEIGAHALFAELSAPGAAAQLAAEALEVHERVDVLVNAAGIGLYKPSAETGMQEVERVMAVNAVAAIELACALMPGMIERGRGHVVDVGSIITHAGRKNEAVYAASKAALALFTESLRFELHGSGVGASLVSPAAVATEFFDRRGEPYGRRFPSQVEPERIARAVVRAIERDRAEILVPGWLGLTDRVRGLAPGLFRLLARKLG